MHHRRVLMVRGVILLAAALLVAACSSPTNPTSAPPADWAVVGRGPSGPVEAGLTLARAPDGSLLARLIVDGGGGDGCGEPSVTKVTSAGGVLTFGITRAPTGNQCLVTGADRIDVLVSETLVAGATEAVIDEPCGYVGCLGEPVPIP